MGPLGHTAVSAGIGAGVWGATGSPVAGGVAVGVGVMTDVDHLFDFFRWYGLRKKGTLVLLLHAWEYSVAGLILLSIFYYHPVFLAVVVAHLGHVATDQYHNRFARWGYFITYRALVRIKVARITPGHNVLNSYRIMPRMLPFGGRLEPWYQRKIEPWFESRTRD